MLRIYAAESDGESCFTSEEMPTCARADATRDPGLAEEKTDDDGEVSSGCEFHPDADLKSGESVEILVAIEGEVEPCISANIRVDKEVEVLNDTFRLE